MTRKLCFAHGGDVSTPSGGSDRVTALASGLQERGYTVHLVVPTPDAALPDRLADVTVHLADPSGMLPGALGRASAVARTAIRVAERENAMVQFEHSTLAGIGSLQGAAGFVLDMHDFASARFDHVETATAPLLKHGVAWLERLAVRRASRIVVVSEVMRDALVDRWAVPESDITVVPNGYFRDRIEPHRNVSPVQGRVCFLGTLHPKVDLRALEQLAESEPVSELVVIGDGAKRAELDRLCREHDALRATGRLPDADAFDLLASAEVAINPQDESLLQRSSSPVKLYYYAALGLPMVVAPGPSVVSTLVDRDAAVTARGADTVTAAVGRLLADASRRAELGANALEAASRFRWSRRIDMLRRQWSQMLEVSQMSAGDET